MAIKVGTVVRIIREEYTHMRSLGELGLVIFVTDEHHDDGRIYKVMLQMPNKAICYYSEAELSVVSELPKFFTCKGFSRLSAISFNEYTLNDDDVSLTRFKIVAYDTRDDSYLVKMTTNHYKNDADLPFYNLHNGGISLPTRDKVISFDEISGKNYIWLFGGMVKRAIASGAGQTISVPSSGLTESEEQWQHVLSMIKKYFDEKMYFFVDNSHVGLKIKGFEKDLEYSNQVKVIFENDSFVTVRAFYCQADVITGVSIQRYHLPDSPAKALEERLINLWGGQ